MKANAYLVLEPKLTGSGAVRSFSIVRATIRPPRSGVYVAITLNVPVSAFGPLAYLSAQVRERDLQVGLTIEAPEDAP